MREIWYRMRPWARFLLVWAVATAIVRGLLSSHLGGTALLYIGVPFAITAALLLADPGDARHPSAVIAA